jgi:putative hydrolase of the HAD superfamily
LRALLLDLDGTLLDHRAAAATAIRAWVPTLGVAAPEDLVERWTALEDEHVSRAERGEVTWQEQRRHRLTALFDLLGLGVATDEVLDAHFADFLGHYEQGWTAYDDVAAAFAAWRTAGVRVAVLTNGVEDQQRRKLASIGVLPDIEFVVALDTLGVGKPDPRVYAEACSRFGLPASGVVYVGDDVARDAIGAHQAGLTGVWLDRFGLPVPPGVDLVIHSLAEVLPLIHRS